MESPLPRLVFVTYSRLVPTTQIGVFKRCLRLMQHLASDFELHLVNFGPLPERDTLFASLRPRLTLHEEFSEDLGNDLSRMFEELAPAAVVFGETPLRGSMRLAHRVASMRGLWQLCIENYYADFSGRFFPSEWPRIDRWLLLGLMPDGRAGMSAEKVEVVPPLVRFPPGGSAGVKDRVTILGYDKQTLLMGAILLRRLPPDQKVDIIVSPEWEELIGKQRSTLGRPGHRVMVLPGDEELSRAISSAKVVMGKAGYQQVVESVTLGTPIIAQMCGGGIDGGLIAPHMKPYVRFVATEEDLEGVMFDVAGWLLDPPRVPWASLGAQVPDPSAYAAGRMRELIGQRPAASSANAKRATG